MPIKVLHYLRHLGLGGTEKTCQLFFEHATRGEFEVAVAYEKSGNHPRMHEFQCGALLGGELYGVDSYAEGTPNSQSLQNVINSFKPDILHVYRSGYPEFPVGQVTVPHVVETNVFGFISGEPQIKRSLFMSKWLMNYAVRRLGPIPPGHPILKRFDFVNNPVERPWSSARLRVRDTWGPDAIVLGRVGRPDNGIYNSVNVQAAKLLRDQGYDIRFIVVAPPSNMLDDLLKYNIPFYALEATTNQIVLSMAYNSMDIYAHARADGETFGVNIAEAMMHGLPVVTHYARPSFPGMGVFQAQTELVDTSETGWVVNNTPEEYAEALKLLIDVPAMRRTMGDAGREKAEREFEVSVCMKKLERIYSQLVQ